METDQEIYDFCKWMRSNERRLFELPSHESVSEIAAQLETIDTGLGAEVLREIVGGRRELIITAFSNPDLFQLVHRIVDGVGPLPQWNVIALKPPRGFAFRITVGSRSISASDLSFIPLLETNAGFRLIRPHYVKPGKNREELAWLVVETGLGEELAGRIQDLDFAEGKGPRGQGIEELAAYVKSAVKI